MYEYCTTRKLDLSPLACVDTLEGIRSGIMGVSKILRAVANEMPNNEQEQMLVCYGILGCAAEALETIKEYLMAEAGERPRTNTMLL